MVSNNDEFQITQNAVILGVEDANAINFDLPYTIADSGTSIVCWNYTSSSLIHTLFVPSTSQNFSGFHVVYDQISYIPDAQGQIDVTPQSSMGNTFILCATLENCINSSFAVEYGIPCCADSPICTNQIDLGFNVKILDAAYTVSHLIDLVDPCSFDLIIELDVDMNSSGYLADQIVIVPVTGINPLSPGGWQMGNSSGGLTLISTSPNWVYQLSSQVAVLPSDVLTISVPFTAQSNGQYGFDVTLVGQRSCGDDEDFQLATPYSIDVVGCNNCNININISEDCFATFEALNTNSSCTFEWLLDPNNPNVVTSTDPNPSYQYYIYGTYSISVNITCGGQTYTCTETLNLSNCTKPCLGDYGFNIVNDNQCNYTFNVFLPNGANPNAYHYIWTLDGGVSITTTVPFLNYSYSGPGSDIVCFTIIDPATGTELCKWCDENVRIACSTPNAYECIVDRDNVVADQNNFGWDIMLDDQGALITTGRKHESPSDADVYVSKFDTDFSNIFSVMGEVSIGEDLSERGMSVIQYEDNYFVLSSVVDTSNEGDFFLGKYNGATGQMLWGKRYDLGRNEIPRSILRSNNDDGFMIFGSSNYKNSALYYEIFAVHVDDNGEIMIDGFGNQKVKAFGSLNKSEYANDVIQLESGDGYLVVGQWIAGQGRDGLSVKIGNDLSLLGHRIYRAQGHESLNSVQSHNGTYYSTGFANSGTTDKDIWYLEFDESLVQSESWIIGTEDINEIAFDIALDANGGVFICGSEKGDDEDGFIYRTEIGAQAQPSWYVSSDIDGIKVQYYSLVEFDQSIFITGQYESSPTEGEINLLKVSKEGEGCCVTASNVKVEPLEVSEDKLLPHRYATATTNDSWNYKGDPMIEDICQNRLEQVTTTNSMRANQLEVVPNPTNHEFRASIFNDQEIYSIEIFDLQGRQIASESYSFTIEAESVFIKLKPNSAGIYIIRIIDTTQDYYVGKVIIRN